jgi:two-component system, chemotaxis family, sensor kinase CheA
MPETSQDDGMEEIIQDFILESNEILDDLDQKLIEFEKDPANEDLLNAIFRAAHTIKGAAGFLAFNQLVDVAHAAEDVLNKLRQGELNITPAVMDGLLQSVDMLKLLLFHVKEKDGKEEEIAPLVNLLNSIKENGDASPLTSTPPKPEEDTPPQEQEAAHKPLKEDAETIRVDISRLDNVLNMVGELVLGRNRLMRLSNQIEEQYGEEGLIASLKQTAYNLNLITSDLQLSVMKTRMLPVAKVFSRFPRMVRDLARKSGKEIDLILEGEDTEMDKTIIEEIGDPLVHLVRNAADHGIETTDERVKAGKPPTGSVTLSAYHKGNNIFISIEDDGKGMDLGLIKARAMEKGIATSDEMDRMSDKEILNFIFHPGFSTAKEVTDISGRGVGLDVVMNNILKLNGSVEIETWSGKGSKLLLRLPLTLAIINVLMVNVGNESYAIPLSMVVEIMRVSGSEITTIEGKEVVYSRDTVYPIVRLSNLVGAEGSVDRGYVIIIALGDKRIAILVDRLLGQEEVVIKSMGDYLSDTKGISGATITGDGRVVLILDVMGLFANI